MGFTKVYPFTTEKLSGYFPVMDLKDKSVFTVGSSGDQVFNALVCGAGKITVFDINPDTSKFYKIKRDLILSVPRDRLVDEVSLVDDVRLTTDSFCEEIIVGFNKYLQDEESYQLLRERLRDDDVSFVVGDIFKMSDSMGEERFDRMFLSNILHYTEYFFPEEDPYQVLKCGFEDWKSHLNEGGILQLLYLYDYSIDRIKTTERFKRMGLKQVYPSASYDVFRVREALGSDGFDIIDFKGTDGLPWSRDSVVTYTKK